MPDYVRHNFKIKKGFRCRKPFTVVVKVKGEYEVKEILPPKFYYSGGETPAEFFGILSSILCKADSAALSPGFKFIALR